MAEGRREEIYLSARELAEHINGKVRTIENWAAAGNIQQNDKGKYGLISAFRYKLLTVEEKLEKAQSDNAELAARLNENSQDARQRKAIAEADKEVAMAKIKELELEKLQGKLIDAEQVEVIWTNLIANCRSKFSSLPTKLALQLSGIEVPEEIQEILAENINECLAELGELAKDK